MRSRRRFTTISSTRMRVEVFGGIALLASALGCGPTIAISVEPNPNPAVPLAAVVKIAGAEPHSASIAVSDGEHDWSLEYDASADFAAGLPVLGMRPDRGHSIGVVLRDAVGGEISAESLSFRTPPLPESGVEFPPLDVTISRPEKMEPGVTLFNPRRREVGRGADVNERNAAFGMLAALDSAGEVVWYYKVDSRISDFEKARNGNILFCTADFRLMEIDWLGNTLHQWYAKDRPGGPPAEGVAVEALTFHHEIDELPNGNIIALSSELKEIDDYFTDEYDASAPRKRQKVMGDVIVEFDRESGEIVWEWHAFDHMDPFRIGYETFSNYWVRRGFPDTVDWSHANNLLYDESDDSVIVNFRYQAAAMKIDRKTKQIRWIFGEPSGWGELAGKVLKPEGKIDWPYHHHSPTPTPNGTLLVYNNGNYEARPFKKPSKVTDTYSRAVEYAINEDEGTVRQIWQSETKGPDSVISIAMGDVEWLAETTNILVAYGALLDAETLDLVDWPSSSRLGFTQWTRMREYVRSEPPEVVFEVVIDGKDSPIGWTLFGVERIDRVGR